MTQTRFSLGEFAPGRRGLAAVALASLALTGCGSEPSGTHPQAEAAGSVASGKPARTSTEQEAFAAMLAEFAQACPPSDGVPLASSATSPGTEPVRSPAPGETPPAGPIEPAPATGPATVLDRHDWCAGGRHEQRIVEALQQVAEPTPARVRKTLNDLGYIDEHIHGLEQDGRTTRFHLDLRENGGRLCQAGLAAGATTDVTSCAAPASGPFAVESEEQR
ncbi:hypothetical protein [Streptomyces sp. t39]|uniref:hypothetical protein n=1 Tax=Streptomyces sp. t39 TaxID=1828156 RepID=UPI0011CD8BAF|nr:hypothetical protein [Streptomyces sp. t39]TXS49931.1 hypothetical protein EAO77_28975 [Streptomyces sp. t39]